ncbi:hypothetical protein CPB86DRAFT_348403 [Serendipita vermifera]|nr:hypothetical protein CPB86DRAFT_348403 [Serendipita vermifera]
MVRRSCGIQIADFLSTGKKGDSRTPSDCAVQMLTEYFRDPAELLALSPVLFSQKITGIPLCLCVPYMPRLYGMTKNPERSFEYAFLTTLTRLCQNDDPALSLTHSRHRCAWSHSNIFCFRNYTTILIFGWCRRLALALSPTQVDDAPPGLAISKPAINAPRLDDDSFTLLLTCHVQHLSSSPWLPPWCGRSMEAHLVDQSVHNSFHQSSL